MGRRIELARRLYPNVVLMGPVHARDGRNCGHLRPSARNCQRVGRRLDERVKSRAVVGAVRAGRLATYQDIPASELRQPSKLPPRGSCNSRRKPQPTCYTKSRTPEATEALTERGGRLRLLVQGHANKDIARDLQIAEEHRQDPCQAYFGEAGCAEPYPGGPGAMHLGLRVHRARKAAEVMLPPRA